MLLIIETITWKPHVETAMEIALIRRDAGQEVIYCNLRNSLPACEDDSPAHRLLDLPEMRTRKSCRILEQHGINYFRTSYTRAELRSARTTALTAMKSCQTLDDLKKTRYANFADIGWGVISSVVSITRNASVSIASHRDILLRYYEASALVYDKVIALIDQTHPSEILLFNGRYATTRAVMRAAEFRGVPWKIHERGGDKDRYLLTDCLPHDMAQIQDKMIAAWRLENSDFGHAFFQSRRNRIERDWHSFTLGQKYGHLPKVMGEVGNWVTFFTSSEDEMFAIGDSYSNLRFPTQMDAIRATAKAIKSLENIRLCIRVHPHVAKKSQSDQRRWAELKLPDVLVIGPDDPVDSYALIDRSKAVCTYGSTVGIEATYWGRPSLLFASSYYDRLNVCEIARDLKHVRDFLGSPVVFPQIHTLPYGAYWETLGVPYKYYQADNLHRGRICGVYLDDSLGMLAWRWLKKFASRIFTSRR